MRIPFTPNSDDVEAEMLRLAIKPANGITVMDVNTDTNEYILEVTESRMAELGNKIGQSLEPRSWMPEFEQTVTYNPPLASDTVDIRATKAERKSTPLQTMEGITVHTAEDNSGDVTGVTVRMATQERLDAVVAILENG